MWRQRVWQTLGGSLLIGMVSAQELSVPSGWNIEEKTTSWILYSRESEQHGQLEYFAHLTTSAPPRAILALLMDTERISEWVVHAKQAQILRVLDTDYYLVLSQFSPPWPIQNRDLVSQSLHWQDNEGIWFEVHATPNAAPKQRHYLRINQLDNCWHARQTKSGITELYHLGQLNDPGSLPDFLINSPLTRTLEQTLAQLQKRLPGYSSTQLAIERTSPLPDWHYCQKLAALIAQ